MQKCALGKVQEGKAKTFRAAKWGWWTEAVAAACGLPLCVGVCECVCASASVHGWVLHMHLWVQWV